MEIKYNMEGCQANLREEYITGIKSSRMLARWHEELEFLEICRGEMIEEINGQMVFLSPGDILFINSRQVHWTKPVREGADYAPCFFRLIQVHPSAFYGDIFMSRNYMLPLINNTDFSHLHIKAQSSEGKRWREMFELCFQIFQSGSASGPLALTGAFYIMISLLKEEFEAHYPASSVHKKSSDLLDVRRMLSFIYENYRKKLSIDDIAGSVPTSRSRCTRLFRRYIEKTPISFLNEYRLYQAARLLRESDAPISDISAECGFTDQSYFGKCFIRQFELSPLKYREKEILSLM